ncbi:hypothetical protein Vadar_034008 [Vaccinium darrowii]|uniref:Uncharacterized protein n=1 Tax=Vaccinium darrowii TaxID=229202 RepID=A0ACB7XVH5_9ERIC|nr:hypothetical protein Vadar_034008 [Vaccinium darrowii]
MSIPSGEQSLNCQQQLQNQQGQLQQQTTHQNLDGGSPLAKDPVYVPGTGARQLTWYMHQQRQRPNDNNIEFWRKFVAEFFAPNAKKRWCVSLYGSSHAVIPQDTWHCEICNIKPSRGFETNANILPRLYQVKYGSGTLEELLYIDMPHEYPKPSGQIVLLYEKAIQECVFEQLRIVRDGQLRIVFSPDLMIYSWEFCARNHEERIPRQMIITKFCQLGEAAQKYQAAAQNTTSSSPTQELQSNSNMFITSAHQLKKAMEVPFISDIGYTKKYVRCLQISDIINCMSDLIEFSRENGTGATESLGKFTQRKNSTSQLHVSGQQTQGQHQLISGENIKNDHSSAPSTSKQQLISGNNSTGDRNSVQLSTSNYVRTVNDSHGATLTSTSATAVLGLPEQNCLNSRNDNQMNYQIPSRQQTRDRRSSAPSASQQQLISGHNSTGNCNSVQLSTSNYVRTVNDSHGATLTSTSATAIFGLPAQKCTNSRNDNQMNYQIPSIGTSTRRTTSLLSPPAHVSPPIPSSVNDPPQVSQSSLPPPDIQFTFSESLGKFTQGENSTSQLHVSGQQIRGQHQLFSAENINNDRSSAPSTSQQQFISGHNSTGNSVQLSTSNYVWSVNDSHGATLTSTSATTILGLPPQNRTNSRNDSQMNYQIPSTGPSTGQTTSLLYPPAPLSPPIPSSANDRPQVSQISLLEASPPPPPDIQFTFSERLGNFTQMTNSTSQLHVSGQQTRGQNQLFSAENINNDHSSAPSTSQQQFISGHNSTSDRNSVQLSTSNYFRTVNDSRGATLTSTSATAILGLPAQNCMNSRTDNQTNYQIPPTGPSTQQTTSLLYPPAPLSPPLPSSVNDPPQVSQSSLPEASPPPLSDLDFWFPDRLGKFTQRKSSTSQLHMSGQQTQGQHQLFSAENINNGRSSAPSNSQRQLISGHNSMGDHTSVQFSTSNYVSTVNDSHRATLTSTSATTILALPAQNSATTILALPAQNCTNSRRPSTRRTTSLLYPPAPLSTPIPSSASVPPQVSQGSLPEASPPPPPLHAVDENSTPNLQLQQFSQSNANPNESMSSVGRIIQEVMALPQFSGMGSKAGGVSLRNNQENTNRITYLSSNSPSSDAANNEKMDRQ